MFCPEAVNAVATSPSVYVIGDTTVGFGGAVHDNSPSNVAIPYRDGFCHASSVSAFHDIFLSRVPPLSSSFTIKSNPITLPTEAVPCTVVQGMRASII